MKTFDVTDIRRKNIIKLFNDMIFQIYNEYNIRCLDDDKNLISEYYKIIQLFNDLNLGLSEHQLISDILNCAKDIKYTVGNLFLYRKYINNPLDEVIKIGNIELFPNYQNIEDRRYSLYASIVAEKLYNYWDRIGDLIHLIMKVIETKNKVYFHSVIENLPPNLSESENFKWLKEFKEKDFVIINKVRKNVVHFRQLETDYYTKHIDFAHDRNEIERLQNEKEKFADDFNTQLNKTIIGFEKTIKLLAEFNEKRKSISGS